MRLTCPPYASLILDDETQRLVIGAADDDWILRATTAVAATKVNWFKENHHTGVGGRIGTYVMKTMVAIFGLAEDQVRANIRHVHRIGHWASTRRTLTTLGIANCIATTTVIVPASSLSAARDVSLRMASAPAGTARTALAYAGLKRLVGHIAIAFCPGIVDFERISPAYNAILANPAAYHTGAFYLTGKKSDYDDSLAAAWLGRIGTHVQVFHSGSTLCKSPYFEKNAVQGYEDYCGNFAAQLMAIKVSMATVSQDLKLAQICGSTVDNYNTLCASMNSTANRVVLGAFTQLDDNEKKRNATSAAGASAELEAQP